ncbi:MAG: tRNA pseudouridine(55) synthase TruB [Peptoniphilus sp.]|nr:tRNA pseudouridine(55) synthase TruB [Peptoniphilus sp.]MDD7362979.1 tRNA pseudouridine(55) synthase TruB [Bacillota bacterium]MDY6044219.1 tRNA pseudouridine(55) synthase TruB [Peptoniphilus sp.]
MNGIILVDKQKGDTSHDVVQKIRHLYHLKQVGHTGTLDPMATGLLPVCLGKATKVAEYISNDKKAYVARAVKGIRTDTGDVTGTVYASSDQHSIPDDMEPILKSFRGEQMQLPPMYSALKYKGRKLYEYAREGICVPRKERPITVSKLELLDRSEEEIDLLAEVSSGTYIRTLIDDIGVACGCYFTMKELRRVSVGNISIRASHTLDEIESMDDAERQELILPMDLLLEHMPAIRLPEHRKQAMLNGMSSHITFSYVDAPYYRVYAGDTFIGLGTIKKEDAHHELFMKKVLK